MPALLVLPEHLVHCLLRHLLGTLLESSLHDLLGCFRGDPLECPFGHPLGIAKIAGHVVCCDCGICRDPVVVFLSILGCLATATSVLATFPSDALPSPHRIRASPVLGAARGPVCCGCRRHLRWSTVQVKLRIQSRRAPWPSGCRRRWLHVHGDVCRLWLVCQICLSPEISVVIRHGEIPVSCLPHSLRIRISR